MARIKRRRYKKNKPTRTDKRRAFKYTSRQQKMDHDVRLNSMKGKTARQAIAWGAASAINDRRAKADEQIAKARANQTYRFGADIIKRTDSEVTPDEQILDWIK